MIVIIILNCIIFSFTSHNYVLADSVSVLVVTRVQSFPSRWVSSLWNTWLAKFYALSLWVILGFFTRFLTNRKIREWCSSYKDSRDDVYAENACFQSESYTEKNWGRVLALIFSFARSLAVSVQQVLAAEITLSLDEIWSLAPVFLPDLAGTSLWVPHVAGDDTSGILALLNFWLWLESPYQTTGTILLEVAVFVPTKFVSFNLNFADKLISKKFQTPLDSLGVNWAAIADRFCCNSCTVL